MLLVFIAADSFDKCFPEINFNVFCSCGYILSYKLILIQPPNLHTSLILSIEGEKYKYFTCVASITYVLSDTSLVVGSGIFPAKQWRDLSAYPFHQVRLRESAPAWLCHQPVAWDTAAEPDTSGYHCWSSHSVPSLFLGLSSWIAILLFRTTFEPACVTN